MPGYLVLFVFVYVSREMGSNTEKWNRSGSSEDYESYSYYSVHLHASAQAGVKHCTSAVVGKFWSLHNSKKLHMCKISWFSGRLFMLTQTW